MSANAEPTDTAWLVTQLVQYQVMLQAYARLITGDMQLAEDVFQEVCLVVTTRPEAVPRDDGVVPWLREVTRRKSLELVRKARRVPLLSADLLEQLGDVFEPDDRGELDLMRETMAGCLEDLPDDARAAIQGRYADELSCERIADEVGRSVQGVYALLKRARVKLQHCVERKLPGMGTPA